MDLNLLGRASSSDPYVVATFGSENATDNPLANAKKILPPASSPPPRQYLRPQLQPQVLRSQEDSLAQLGPLGGDAGGGGEDSEEEGR